MSCRSASWPSLGELRDGSGHAKCRVGPATGLAGANGNNELEGAGHRPERALDFKQRDATTLLQCTPHGVLLIPEHRQPADHVNRPRGF